MKQFRALSSSNTCTVKCAFITESKESTRPLVLTRKNLASASGLSFFVQL